MWFYTRTTKESPAKPNRLARDQTEPDCQRGSGRLSQLGKPSGRGLRWGSAAEPQGKAKPAGARPNGLPAWQRNGLGELSSALVCSFEFSAQLGSFGSAFGPALLHSAQLRSAQLGSAFCPTLSSSGPLSALLLLRNSNPALSPTHNASLDRTRVPVGV